jgi:hypothetical protein
VAAVGGCVLLAAALAGFVGFAGWGLALIGAAFVLVDLARSLPLAAAPLYGAGLLLAGELVYAARELAVHAEERPERRVPWLAGIAAVGLGVAFVPVAATQARAPRGFAAELLALAAAGVLLGVPALLARRRLRSCSQEEPTTSG